MSFLEESYKQMQKIQILKFWECPLHEIWEYAFNLATKHYWYYSIVTYCAGAFLKQKSIAFNTFLK